MEVMDVDEGGSSQRLALIRAVRTLDESSSLPLPEKIHKLWLLLTAVKHTRLHGVEESILRWLLKQMSGNTESAEHVRRYPLAWTILSHVFPKIPAQALGRSLAYLRFVSILNKTLGDLTTQETQSTVPETEKDVKRAKKRKRAEDWPADLAELRTSLGCLRTASEVFEALAILLEQATAQTGGVTAEKRVGAEHVKSLFSSAGDETRDITARLLSICDDSLSSTGKDLIRGRQSWIDTLTTVWNLRLRSNEESFDFARYIYGRASLVLGKLDSNYSGQDTQYMDSTCRDVWVSQLRMFLATYFIRPARQSFGLDKNIEVLKLALRFAHSDIVAATAIMWSIAARTPRDASNPKSKIEHDAWVENVFQALLEGLQPLARQEKNEVLSRLLDIALRTQSIPDTKTLSVLYQQLVLDETQTDWTLLSKILACDTDVLVSQDPETIFDSVSKVSHYGATMKDEIVTQIIIPLQDAFSKARDLAGFVTQWLRCLRSVNHVEQSIWFDSRIREHLATILQSSLSSTQLLRLLEGLEPTPDQEGGLLVVLDGICAGLTDESTIANLDSKIVSMMDRKWGNISSDVLALRWRIFGYLASWEASKECNKLWKNIKSDMKPILKKGPLTSAETFEAFSCCYKLCLSNHIGGKYEEALTKLVASMIQRLCSSVNGKDDLQAYKAYVDLVFNRLPKLSESSKNEPNTLTPLIVRLFWHVSYENLSPQNAQTLDHVRSLIHNYDVADEESMMDALMAPLFEVLDDSENRCAWTEPYGFNLLSILLEFPVEVWTRGRRKRIMASWKRKKSEISSHAARDSAYSLILLRLLVKIVQQPTFYEEMEFTDLVDICSNLASSDIMHLSLVERFVDTTIRHVLTNVNESTQSYILTASQYAENLKPGAHSRIRTQILLLKSLVAALTDQKSSNSDLLERLGVQPDVFRKKLSKVVEWALNDFASEVKKSSEILPSERLDSLSIFLDAAQVVSCDAAHPAKIGLSDNALTQLEKASNKFIPRDASVLWKLRSFLMKQSPDRYPTQHFSALLDEGDNIVEEESMNDFVDAYVQAKGDAVRDELLGQLIDPDKLVSGPIGPILAARRLLECYSGPNTDDTSASAQGGLDFAKLHEHFTSHLSQTSSLLHFKQISETMIFFLDKHGNTMTQYNIEATLTSVVEVCSAQGPKIQTPKAAGEIFASLFKLVALIIKRYRLRLSGHFHLLLAALRALMTVLLTDPTSSALNRRSAQSSRPPWLLTRLQPRHGERFARLLTLICEPSAAAVARSRGRSELDSATDAAKRAAGQYMYLVLEMYVKLQLEVEVSREMRKALEVGVFSVLDITSEGCRQVVNESLDAGGRVVFRALFAEYRKFGKWKGV
ncbi:hypothetical protein GGS21DRAFT_201702 [Xylaria nigripes]|nr:hypothetical protein GGS21DRAFT_201702 [Xylaria nigripes]